MEKANNGNELPVIFLTSSFMNYETDEKKIPEPIEENYGFFEKLKDFWKENSRILFWAANPEEIEYNDYRAMAVCGVLKKAGLSVGSITVCDRRNARCLDYFLSECDVLYLAGGHGPSANRFMEKNGLRAKIAAFKGVIIGLSAGSVNAAANVYMFPELAGEAEDTEFQKKYRGLGLTDLNIIPHAEYERIAEIDGKSIYNEYLLQDSYEQTFYLVNDGSYFLIHNGITSFYGKGFLLKNGEETPLESGVTVPLKKKYKTSYLNACEIKKGEIWKTLMSDIYEVVATLDCDGSINFVYLSKKFLDIGITPERVKSLDHFTNIYVSKFVSDDEKQAMAAEAGIEVIKQSIERDGEYTRSCHFNLRGGTKTYIVKSRMLGNESDKYYFEMYNISAELNHDWMTDEYAATGFMDKASELLMKLPKDKKYSLIYTNVRGFRAINDIFGEQSGDIAIFQIRDAIRKYLNPIILGRLEADHYVLIAEDDKITDEAMTRLSHRMFTKGSKDYHFDLCMGIVPIEDRTESIRLLIDRAVLVEKKISGNGGRTFARYDSNLQINYIMDRMLSSDMDISLENGEFKVYYQPVVNAKSKKIVSAEALIRWQHHNLGMVGPGRFIPLFEETGQISAIDRFIASHVLEFNKKRDITGRKIVPCAVNLSRIDFYDSRLLYDILAYIYNDKNTERYIKFEVTESAYAVMESSALEFLNALHSKNIQILLDDFGSGMSSLSTLESFNFNIVKLDMGFIRKINISKKAEAIIKSTIRMSHSLGSKVVAEGVEDESQYQFLKDAGCDMIQGYYFYKPMPEEEFVKLLNEQQKR